MTKPEIVQLAITLDRFTQAHNLLSTMSVPHVLGNPTNFFILLEELGTMQNQIKDAMDHEFHQDKLEPF